MEVKDREDESKLNMLIGNMLPNLRNVGYNLNILMPFDFLRPPRGTCCTEPIIMVKILINIIILA